MDWDNPDAVLVQLFYHINQIKFYVSSANSFFFRFAVNIHALVNKLE